MKYVFARLVVVVCLCVSCSSSTGIEPRVDVPPVDVGAGEAVEWDVGVPDVVTDAGKETVWDYSGNKDVQEFLPECEPGSGCFGEACADGSDCLSGLCVEHMGNLICSMQCVEECPSGWTCKEVGSGGPDVNWVCVSDFRMLCRPCSQDQECTSSTGQETQCVSYGSEGSFCGGECGAEKACPGGYVCSDAGQCLAESGQCECSDTAIVLGLETACFVQNDHGVCAGVRVCTEEGLTACDAPEAAQEVCNGVDDDCDGQADSGKICEDDNACTEDICLGFDGCEFSPLDSTNCDDLNACTLTDHCDEGECVGTPIACDDSNPCTDDSCDGMEGCTFVLNSASCDDGDPCTIGDQCLDAACAGVPVSCDCQSDADCKQYEDGNKCNGTLYCDKTGVEYQCKVDPDTVVVCPEPPFGPDSDCLKSHCHPPSGLCDFAQAHEGFACEDGDVCTYGGVCLTGKCLGNEPVNCNDGNQCTLDECHPETGCQYAALSGPCSDDNACTFPDQCSQGSCISGLPLDCDDFNPCTADSCDPLKGCVHSATDGACDDGNACTTGDFCSAGQCVGAGLKSCKDDNPCTGDICNPAVGCSNPYNAASCDDSDLCTVGDHCEHGDCIPGQGMNCDDGNSCTSDSCNPLVGCVHTNSSGQCDDQDPCSTGDKCSGGVCVGIGAKDCNDNNLCTEDICIPMAGCSHVNNSAPCNDGDVCTVNDLCVLGECIPGKVTVCDDGNVCTDDSCDALKGCGYVANDDNCDDGNSCTTGDKCVAGVCKGEGSLECDDGNPCTKDICLPGGGCQHENIEGACSDGNPCTVNDSCVDGLCVSGAGFDCDDSNPCTDDSCDATGTCVHAANQAVCDDGNPCTVGDHCDDSKCKVTGPLDCDDNNACTTDWCDPGSGCINANNQLPCTDGDVCTLVDTCQDGQCVGSNLMVCDDFNVCTDDGCAPESGCQFVANEAGCSDGNKCTEGDSCGAGWCQPGTPLDCDDEDICTTDSCNPLEGCVYLLNDNPCSDGDACTGEDTCVAGVCTGGPALDCDDANLCTDDSCDPGLGCVHEHNQVECDDENLCTVGDKCEAGACMPGPEKDCDDSNSCTEDLCEAEAGCVNNDLPDDTVCADDGDECTTDLCLNGECVHGGDGWSSYNGHCYKWFAGTKNWSDARTHCQTFGGDLASVADAAENSFVHSLADDSTASWTGFNDQASEGSWKWSDGTAVTYTNWNGGEPNNSGNEDCMHLYKYAGQSSSGRWNDANCGSGYPYTCER